MVVRTTWASGRREGSELGFEPMAALHLELLRHRHTAVGTERNRKKGGSRPWPLSARTRWR